LDGAGRTCDKTATDTIVVQPKVTAGFGYSVNNCGNTLQFTDSSYVVVTSWDWNFGDGIIDSTKNPLHSYNSPGTYTVWLVADNQYGCKDSIQKIITLAGFNPISVSANSYDCKNNPIQLNASGGIAYQWSPAMGLSNPNISNPVATPTTTTQYTVNITQVSGNDTCVSTLHTSVTVPSYSTSTLTAYAHPDTIYVGQTTQLGTQTSGGNIVWVPNYNISSTTDPFPTAWPDHTTTYMAMYTDPHGCTFPVSSVTIYVIAKDCDEHTVFVPNTFTPNADGANDVLYARSSLVTDIHFMVADRWGQIVFETNDITKGWDGNFNGKPCNPDVFGYYITYKCNNGKDSFKKGNVTLIR
jgi:gliding motility-associated-like protein